jgi:hypothetical protein
MILTAHLPRLRHPRSAVTCRRRGFALEDVMEKASAVLFAVTMTLWVGCASSDDSSDTFSCENVTSKCPNDPPIDVADCKKDIGHPTCGHLIVTLARCMLEHQTCLPDGTTDSDTLLGACATPYGVAEQCRAVSDAGLRR